MCIGHSSKVDDRILLCVLFILLIVGLPSVIAYGNIGVFNTMGTGYNNTFTYFSTGSANTGWVLATQNNYTYNSFGWISENALEFNLTGSAEPNHQLQLQAWNTTDLGEPHLDLILSSSPSYVLNALNCTWYPNDTAVIFGQQANETMTVSFITLGRGILIENSTSILTTVSDTVNGNVENLNLVTGSSGTIAMYLPEGMPAIVQLNGNPVGTSNWSWETNNVLILHDNRGMDTWNMIWRNQTVAEPVPTITLMIALGMALIVLTRKPNDDQRSAV